MYSRWKRRILNCYTCGPAVWFASDGAYEVCGRCGATYLGPGRVRMAHADLESGRKLVKRVWRRKR